MIEFKKENLSAKDAFWVMWHFLQEHYDLSNGTFELSDVLSACEPIGDGAPADSSMIEYWNEAIEKYKEGGKPDMKEFNN